MKVLTVTFNPALDRQIVLDNFQVNKLHRVSSLNDMELSPGGKGINVSLALENFGVPSVAMGFLGGYMGRILLDELRKRSKMISTNFVFIRGETRENIEIIDPVNKTITEINSPGPEIEEEDINHLMRRFIMTLSRVEVVVISGSIPMNAPDDLYPMFVKEALSKGKVIFVETTDKNLTTLYKSGVMPTVVKPDLRAGNYLLGKELENLEDFVEAGKKLLGCGAKLVVLSYHVDSDIIMTEDGVWMISPTVEIDYSHLLGTGDTYMAAMVYDYINGEKDLVEIGKFGYIAALAKTKKLRKELPTLQEVREYNDKYAIKKVG